MTKTELIKRYGEQAIEAWANYIGSNLTDTLNQWDRLSEDGQILWIRWYFIWLGGDVNEAFDRAMKGV